MVLLGMLNSYIRFAVSLVEKDFMSPCLFIYVNAVMFSEKILTCLPLESFRKAIVLIQLLVILKH